MLSIVIIYGMFDDSLHL